MVLADSSKDSLTSQLLKGNSLYIYFPYWGVKEEVNNAPNKNAMNLAGDNRLGNNSVPPQYILRPAQKCVEVTLQIISSLDCLLSMRRNGILTVPDEIQIWWSFFAWLSGFQHKN